MKTDEAIKEIHEIVTEIRLDQVRFEEHIKENRKDIAEHKKDLAELKQDNQKLKGAGLLGTALISAKFLWEGLFK